MPSIAERFADGLKSLTNSMINRRAAGNSNTFERRCLSSDEQKAIYQTGLGSKIVRLKAGGALADTLQFQTTEDREFFEAVLKYKVREAARWMLAFGRGIIVVHMPGDDLRKPLEHKRLNEARARVNVFSGDMISVMDIDRDLQSARYYEPTQYMVRGHTIHHSRVVDFRYIRPPEMEAPHYQYGGISEFDFIYDQLAADGIVQRASPRVIEKASTLFYKVDGFKEAISTGNEKNIVDYFSRLEDMRGIFGVGILDKEDEVMVSEQTISNLADADQITLRRLAMVTGLSITRLVGENVKGLNSSGDNESSMDQEMLETFQDEYLLPPINELMALFGRSPVEFKDNQGETAKDRMDYESTAIQNALALWQMGEDHTEYLRERDILKPDDFDAMFNGENANGGQSEEDARTLAEFEQAGGNDGGDTDDDAVDPERSLNGAQIEGLLGIISRIRTGELTQDTAKNIIMAAFPLSLSEAQSLVGDVPYGVDKADAETSEE